MAFVTYFSGFAGTDLTPAQRSQPSRLGRPQRHVQYECSNASVGAFLGLGLLSSAQARRSKFHSGISHRLKVQLAARRRGRSKDVDKLDPFKHLTPRAEDLEPGERLFQQVYQPNMRVADFPEDEQTDQEEPDNFPKKRRGKAEWLAANQELKKDPAYGKKWVLDPRKSGPKKKRWAVGEVVDEVQDIDKDASRLRTMYKRPRFDWKDAQKDDLRTEAMSGKMAAIGNDEVWISKFLSHSGVCSRRRVKELVLQGRITVNGDVIQDPVLKIDPKKDTVAVDGKVQNLRTLDELVWVMLNKPKDILSTLEDPAGRKTVADLVPFARARRLVPIGRLERNSTGIILLTNDYEWHTVLAHPRYEMPKRYRVTVYNGAPDSQRMQALQTGLHLPDEGRPCLPLEELEVLQNDRRLGMATLGFVMKEGKYRQILRMFEFIGHPIRAVKRTQIGLVRLDKELKAGEYRMLTPKEIRRLKGSTILKKPLGDPIARAKKTENVFSGSEDDIEFDELDRPQSRTGKLPHGRRREGDGTPRGSRRGLKALKAEEEEPQEASLQGLRALEDSAYREGGASGPEQDDWETSWIQQLDEMSKRTR